MSLVQIQFLKKVALANYTFFMMFSLFPKKDSRQCAKKEELSGWPKWQTLNNRAQDKAVQSLN